MPVDRDTMRSLAKKVDYALNGTKKGTDRPHAFMITAFPMVSPEEDYPINYITSAKRADYIQHLELLLEQLKAQEIPF